MKEVTSAKPRFALTKLEATHRQLDCAIDLWIEEKDPVSIHTLVNAAHQVVYDVGRHRGSDVELIYNSSIIKEEHRKEVIDHIKKPANFVKHADYDPEEIYYFSPVAADFLIVFTILGLEALGERKSPQQRAFMLWMQIQYPQIMSDAGKQELSSWFPDASLDLLRSSNKQEFFAAALKAFVS